MQSEHPTSSDQAALIERLRHHRVLSQALDYELAWLVEHGTLETHRPGDRVQSKGDEVDATYIVLTGHITTLVNQDGTWRKAIEWKAGDITGYLPYSRAGKAQGHSVADEYVEALKVPRKAVEQMPVVCPRLTEILVHAMIDRTREFSYSERQVETFASLGKLAAGIAHELVNPTSAALRCAQQLTTAIAVSNKSSRALERAHLSDDERVALDRVRTRCLASSDRSLPSSLEQAEREQALAAWLVDHDLDESLAVELGDANMERGSLDELAGALRAETLDAAVRWVGAACVVQELTREIEDALTRVHKLVAAVKGFTYMDRDSAPVEVNLEQGLADTMAVLGAKAREKSVEMQLSAEPDLPAIQGFGGELNQVWANIIDNAIDAAPTGGRVHVDASHNDESAFVRVVDDGPGIPPDIEERIFEPFFTTKPIGTGTGLGLGIAQRLVTRNDGAISVSSRPGRTEFCVTLPLSPRRAPGS